MPRRIHRTEIGTFDVVWGTNGEPDQYPHHEHIRSDMLSKKRTEPIHLDLTDPLYPSETKRLGIYRADDGRLVVFGEISMGIYAQGVQITEDQA